jgi:hypothetical protein
MLVLVAIGIGIYLSQHRQSQHSVYSLLSRCHFDQGICQQVLSDSQVLHFKLSPPDAPPMEPLTLRVSGISGIHLQANDIKVWFEGRDMSMGQHYMLPVVHHTQEASEVLLEERTFKGMIPICSVDESMVWRLVVEFPFDSIAPYFPNVSGSYSRLQIHFELM